MNRKWTVALAVFGVYLIVPHLSLGQWTDTGPMQSERGFPTSHVLPDGTVLVLGGRTSTAIIATSEIYDPVSSTWSAAGSMANVRYLHASVLLTSGDVLVTGGATGFGNLGQVAAAEIFDPGTKTWSPVSPMSVLRSNHTATLLPDGRALVVGGSSSNSFATAHASAEIYDPVAGQWTPAASMSVPRREHSTVPLLDGRLLVIAGYSWDGGIVTLERPPGASRRTRHPRDRGLGGWVRRGVRRFCPWPVR